MSREVFEMNVRGKSTLFLQPAEQSIKHGLAVLFIDRFGQWNVHRTDLYAVLRVAAVGNAVVTHDRLQTLVAIHGSRWVQVEETNLSDRLRTDVVIAFVLRTGFETAAARHAARVGVALHHVFLVHARAGPEVVRAVEFDPGVNALEVIEHLRAIDHEIAHVWKLGHRLEFDRLIEIVDERGAGLAHASVDDHRADAADLLETVHVP